jgi:hypothetical protein
MRAVTLDMQTTTTGLHPKCPAMTPRADDPGSTLMVTVSSTFEPCDLRASDAGRCSFVRTRVWPASAAFTGPREWCSAAAVQRDVGHLAKKSGYFPTVRATETRASIPARSGRKLSVVA